MDSLPAKPWNNLVPGTPQDISRQKSLTTQFDVFGAAESPSFKKRLQLGGFQAYPQSPTAGLAKCSLARDYGIMVIAHSTTLNNYRVQGYLGIDDYAQLPSGEPKNLNPYQLYIQKAELAKRKKQIAKRQGRNREPHIQFLRNPT